MSRLTCAAALAAGFLALSSAAAGQKDGLKFEIYKGKDAEFRWRLKAANNEILATAGQGYKDKADAKNSIESLQKASADAKAKFEVYEDAKKEYRWRLKATNDQIVAASSEGYKEKGGAEKALATVKAGAAKADVAEVKE